MNRKTIIIPLVALIIGLLIGALVTYATSSSSTFVAESGVYPGAPSYTIWGEGSTYFAKDAYGLIAFSGTNASYIITTCLHNTNGEVLLEDGIYSITSTIIIDKNGSQLIGSGSGRNQKYFCGVLTPMLPPTPLERMILGTVLRIDTADIDGIQIVGAIYGITIKNLAIDFNVATTGHGIYGRAFGGDIGVSEIHFSDIIVNNNDVAHYALKLENAALGMVDMLTNFGGPLLELTVSSTTALWGTDFFCGNIIFNQLSCWLTKNIITHAVWIHRINGTGVLDLYQFNRLFVITAGCNLTGTVYGLSLECVYVSQFNMADIEMWYVVASDVVHLADCHEVSFLNPYIMYSPGGGWMAWTDCIGVMVSGGVVDIAISDRSRRDLWQGVSVSSLDPYHVAVIEKCRIWNGTMMMPTYNCGYITITANNEITFAHGLWGAPTHVLVSINSTAYGCWGWDASTTLLHIKLETVGSYLIYWEAEYNYQQYYVP